MPPSTEHKPGFEERDVDVFAVLRPALGLLLVIVLSFVAMYWTMRFLQWGDRQKWSAVVARTKQWPREQPPEPRLQTAPWEDLAAMRAEEEKLIGRYAWVDRKAGTVRIPVERAIEVLAARGLPVREPTPAAGVPGAAPAEAPAEGAPAGAPAANEAESAATGPAATTGEAAASPAGEGAGAPGAARPGAEAAP